MGNSNNGFRKTKKRVLTRRGVLWLGQTCNLRCHFCYFLDRIKTGSHPEHAFMSIDKAKKICTALVEFYGNNAIDIQGGEPTIYPHIHELVSHCRRIGLIPTLITNALVLDRKDACLKLLDAGVRDLLISIHGLREPYDDSVGVPGAHARQMQALENLIETGIPFRFNCVLAKSVLPDLSEVAKLAIETNARVVNFITFNPFEDQQNNKRSIENVPSYGEVSSYLMEAMDILIEADVECNVRYFPFCMVEEKYRKHFYNFQQLPYDLHEWDYASWSWTGQTAQRMKPGDVTDVPTLRQANLQSNLFGSRSCYAADDSITREDEYRHSALVRAREHCRYKYSRPCPDCSLYDICDGFHGDYAGLFGAKEARPVESDARVDDPTFFINQQGKIVEKEDYDWAL